MFLKQKQEESIVKEDKNYYIVDKAVLPEINIVMQYILFTKTREERP